MRYYLLALCWMTLAGPVWAGGQDLYEKATFSADGKKLLYRVLKPAKIEEGKKYPLVLFLHGAGERGDDNNAQLVHGGKLFTKAENRANYPCFVIFPQCPGGKSWVDADWGDKKSHTMPKEPSEPLRLTKQLLDQFIKDNPVDAERIYVMGLSMGGFGTWDFTARYPDFVAAAAPICGGADIATAPKIKHIAVWAFHGDKDTAVWPERSRAMVEELKKVKGIVHYSEYKDVGHNSWDRAFAEPELLPWMFAQKRLAK
jgi:predicted peptidase